MEKRVNISDDCKIKQFWISRLYHIEDVGVAVNEKADDLRCLLYISHQMVKSGKMSQSVYSHIHKQLSTECSSMLHNQNSFVELVAGMMTNKKVANDSGNWYTTLLSTADRQPVCVPDVLSKIELSNNDMQIMFSQRKQREMSNKVNDLTKNRKVTYPESRTSAIYDQRPPLDNFKTKALLPTVKSGEQREIQQHNAPLFGKRKLTENKFNSVKINEDFPHEEEHVPSKLPFLTAREQLIVDQRKIGRYGQDSISASCYGNNKKSLGTRRGVSSKFVPPVHDAEKNEKKAYNSQKEYGTLDPKYEGCEWMKNVDPKMVELIENEIMEHGPGVNWDDIAGLEFAKSTIQEIVIWPMLRPDIFTGLRGPPKGLLLFGPPGTGKTLIGKCIASQSNATFFAISASSLTSKWIGEGEKMVRALFGVARCHQPAVIFIDEIDSLLTQRSDSEHESSRRIKTEFLVHLDGATCSADDRILIVGATNRPQELDEAARRRLVKRLYIPLPESKARKQIIKNLMQSQSNTLTNEDIDKVMEKTDGFSGADMANLCRDAALGPIRSIGDIRNINANDVRPVTLQDFENALKFVRPSVSQNDLQPYIDWNQQYGCCGGR